MRKPHVLILEFPRKGIDVNFAQRAQPQGTTFEARNVRVYDVTGRSRGGQRPGLSKYCSAQAGSVANRIQGLIQVNVANTDPAVQTAVGFRTSYFACVQNGKIYRFTTSAMNVSGAGTPLSATAPVIYGASLFSTVYFVDGTNSVTYTPSTNAYATWTAASGTLPANCRLICQWRGRIVLSGKGSDPHNWFMSAKDDATDWDYSPATVLETQAVAGNNSEAGYIGQMVTALIPYSDDILIFGCDSQIWQMTGDPMAGGRLDLISDSIGMAWGQAWCKSPTGVLYFFGSRGGLFRLVPGQKPEHMSAARIESRLTTQNLNTHIVRLAWNDKTPGVHIFITPLTADAAVHYFWDARTDSFWEDTFYQTKNPVCTFTADGDSPDDRVLLLGSEDGYIRFFDEDADDDDGALIDSHVFIGPIQVEGETLPFVISEIQAVLGRDSNDVAYSVYCASSSEAVSDLRGYLSLSGEVGYLTFLDGYFLAFSNDSNGDSVVISRGTLSPTRSVVRNTRCRGYSAYIKLYNSNNDETWSMEHLRVRLNAIATSRGREP